MQSRIALVAVSLEVDGKAHRLHQRMSVAKQRLKGSGQTIGDLFRPSKVILYPSNSPSYRRTPADGFEVVKFARLPSIRATHHDLNGTAEDLLGELDLMCFP